LARHAPSSRAATWYRLREAKQRTLPRAIDTRLNILHCVLLRLEFVSITLRPSAEGSSLIGCPLIQYIYYYSAYLEAEFSILSLWTCHVILTKAALKKESPVLLKFEQHYVVSSSIRHVKLLTFL
jgi:hypothetical protein